MNIIGVTGRNGAGKSTFIREFQKRLPNSMSISTGDIFRDILRILCMDETRENLILLSRVLRENFHRNIVVNVVRDKINKCRKDYLLVDGVRGQKIKKLLDEFDNSLLVSIKARPGLRYRRVVERERNLGIQKKISRVHFLTLDAIDFSEEIAALEKESDITLENNSSYADFCKKIDALIKKLKK